MQLCSCAVCVDLILFSFGACFFNKMIKSYAVVQLCSCAVVRFALIWFYLVLMFVSLIR